MLDRPDDEQTQGHFALGRSEDPGLSSPVSPLGQPSFLRLPDRRSGGIEALAADANRRLLESARARIAMGPCPIDDLDVVRVLTDRLTAMDMGAVRDHLDDHLAHDDLRSPRMEIIAPDEQDVAIACRASYDLVRPDLGALGTLLQSSRILSIRHLDAYSPVLAALAADIETVTGNVCRIDALLCDTEATLPDDPIVPQARFFLVVDGMVRIEGKSTDPVDASAGSVVVVPAGVAVTAMFSPESFVLRVPVPFPTRLTLRSEAVDHAHFHPKLRADTPGDLSHSVVSYAGSVFDDHGGFAVEATAALGPDALDAAMAARRAAIRPRPHHDPLSVLENFDEGHAAYRFIGHGGVLVETLSGVTVPVVAGHRLGYPAEVLEDLVPLMDGSHFELASALRTASAGESVKVALRDLSALDLFEVQRR